MTIGRMLARASMLLLGAAPLAALGAIQLGKVGEFPVIMSHLRPLVDVTLDGRESRIEALPSRNAGREWR
jgi:hypothetical protein